MISDDDYEYSTAADNVDELRFLFRGERAGTSKAGSLLESGRNAFDGCPLHFMYDYKGTFCWAANTLINGTKDAQHYTHCYEYCKGKSSCKKFTYDASKKKCYMKNSDGNCFQQKTAYYVSGDKYMDSNIIYQCKSCKVNNWSHYSPCTASCKGGTKSRTRSVQYADTIIKKPLPGDEKKCASVETTSCNDNIECDCRYEVAGDWQPCNRTCDGGFEKRARRAVKYGDAQIDLSKCRDLAEYRSCGESPCIKPNDVSLCHNPPCFSGCKEEIRGESPKWRYLGCQHVNRDGFICRRWDEVLDEKLYVENMRLNTGVGTHNFCRVALDPVSRLHRHGLWCYSSESRDHLNVYSAGSFQPDYLKTPVHHGVDEINGKKYSWVYCNPAYADAKYNGFGEWSVCAATCGDSYEMRVKKETVPRLAAGTSEPFIELRPCNLRECPPRRQHCVMEWTAWGQCSGTCDGEGNFRERTYTVVVDPVDSWRLYGRGSEHNVTLIADPCEETAMQSGACSNLSPCPAWYDEHKGTLSASAGAALFILLLAGISVYRMKSQSARYHTAQDTENDQDALNQYDEYDFYNTYNNETF